MPDQIEEMMQIGIKNKKEENKETKKRKMGNEEKRGKNEEEKGKAKTHCEENVICWKIEWTCKKEEF